MCPFFPVIGNNQGSRADNPSHHSITSKRHSDPIKKSDDDFDEYEGDESDGEFRVPLMHSAKEGVLQRQDCPGGTPVAAASRRSGGTTPNSASIAVISGTAVPLGQLPGSLDIDDHQLATGDSVASASEDNQVSASCAPAAEVSSSSVSGMTIPDVAIVLVHSGET